MKVMVEDTLKLQEQFRVSDETMEKYLYSNAARLLRIKDARAQHSSTPRAA
jgi:predicted TIM-barrel fold metal-dependent hydrolase